VVAGTPEQVARCRGSYTGQALAKHLDSQSATNRTTRSNGKPKTATRHTRIENIRVEGARQHNLKDVTVNIPRERMTVCSGPSGSGKSSLAIDTIYAEGQRRYVESLSSYARQF